MNLLLWITIGFIIIGFIILISMKKKMESKLNYIIENSSSEESSLETISIVWWVIGVAAWGVISIFLISWLFQNYFG